MGRKSKKNKKTRENPPQIETTTDSKRRRTDTEKTDSASLDSFECDFQDLTLESLPAKEELDIIGHNLDILSELASVFLKSDTEKLPPGYHVYECQAYIFTVSNEHRKAICHFCLLEYSEYIHCRCRFAQYCGKRCQEMDYKLYHRYECDILEACMDSNLPSTLTRFLAQLSRKIRENADEVGDQYGRRIFSIFTMPSRSKDVFQIDKASQEFFDEMDLITSLCGRNNVTSENVMMDIFDRARLYCRDVDVGFRRNVGIALSLGLQAFHHSCKPNCVVTWRDKKAVVRTMEEVTLDSDNELTISWIPTFFGGLVTRNDMLFDLIFFPDMCECKRCWDDDFDLLVKEVKPEMPEMKNVKFLKTTLENPKSLTKRKLEHVFNVFSKLHNIPNYCSDRILLMEKIAKACVDYKKYEKAKQFYRKLINAYEFYYGHNHPMTGVAYFALFFVERVQQKFPDALTSFNNGYERLKVAYGNDHPFIQGLLQEKENN